MTDALSADSRRKFVWAEISYLELWWNEQNEHKKEQFKRFVYNRKLLTLFVQGAQLKSYLHAHAQEIQ